MNIFLADADIRYLPLCCGRYPIFADIYLYEKTHDCFSFIESQSAHL